MSQFRISAKLLGQLALPTFCGRCFWIRIHCGDNTPFSVFPSIFSHIDAYSKRITMGHFGKHRELPAWFDSLGRTGQPIHVPHWSKFCMIDAQTNIRLVGMPDEMIRRDDGSLLIVDYKCARLTEAADELAPLYRTQLNVYGLISSHLKLGPVSGLVLFYYEPITTLIEMEVDSLVHDTGFEMRFSPKVVPVP